MGDTFTAEQRLCEKIARALWLAATSDDQAIARYDNGTYSGLESALLACIPVAYAGLTPEQVQSVRNLLAELGPFDGARGTQGIGIASYVQYVRDNPDNPVL